MDPAVANFLQVFLSLLWEAMPFIVLGAIAAGILEEFLPQELITRIMPKALVPSVVIGSLLGLLFPMCECGIVVVMRRLLRKGVPLSACIAYMLGGPIINVVVIGSTWVAFDMQGKGSDKPYGIAPEMVGLRMGLGFLVACITAVIVHFQYKRYGNTLLTAVATPREAVPVPVAKRALPKSKEEVISAQAPAGPALEAIEPRKKTILDRLGNIAGTSLQDFVDITVFLILGAVLAALARHYISNEEIKAFSQQQPILAIPLMMVLAVLVCLCSEADAFVAASFKELHVSAKIAFLVLGPMLDLKLLMMFTRVFKLRLIITLVVSTVLLVLVFALMIHGIYAINGWSGHVVGS